MLDLPLNLPTLLVSTLATWQLTALLHYDRGPFGMLIHARGVMRAVGFKKLVSCFYCLCLWMSLFVVLVIYRISWLTPIVALAVGGAVSLIDLRIGWVTRGRGVAGSRELIPPQPSQAASAAPPPVVDSALVV